MPFSTIAAASLSAELLDNDYDADSERRLERRKHLYGRTRSNQPQDFVVKYGQATAFKPNFYEGLNGRAKPSWMSTMHTDYTPKDASRVASKEASSAVSKFMTRSHFEIGQDEAMRDIVSATQRDYQPKSTDETDKIVASGSSLSNILHYPAVFRDQKYEKVENHSLYGASYTPQQFRERSLSAHMTTARKLGNRTNFDLGDGDDDSRHWVSVTKSQIVPMQPEAPAFLERMDKNRSTVLDAPDSEANEWISTNQKDFKERPTTWNEQFTISPLQLKNDNKTAHFSFPSDLTTLLDSNVSQYNASFTRREQMESPITLRNNTKKQQASRHFNIISEQVNGVHEGADVVHTATTTNQDDYKRPASAEFKQRKIPRTLNGNISSIVYSSEDTSSYLSVTQDNFREQPNKPIDTQEQRNTTVEKHQRGSHVWFGPDHTSQVSVSTMKDSFRGSPSKVLAPDYNQLMAFGKKVSQQQAKAHFELGTDESNAFYCTTTNDHTIKNNHDLHRRTLLKPDTSYATSLRNTVAGFSQEQNMYGTTTHDMFTNMTEYMDMAKPDKMSILLKDSAQSLVHYESDSAKKYYISTTARIYLPPDVRRT